MPVSLSRSLCLNCLNTWDSSNINMKSKETFCIFLRLRLTNSYLVVVDLWALVINQVCQRLKNSLAEEA